MNDFNSPNRLFHLWQELTGENLMPVEKHEKHGREKNK
jgi:hypothetical protein